MSQILSRVLTKDNIITHLSSESKEEAIMRAGKHLVASGFVEEAYIDKMLEREKITTTFIGSGVAIPHGTKEGKKFVKRLVLSFYSIQRDLTLKMVTRLI